MLGQSLSVADEVTGCIVVRSWRVTFIHAVEIMLTCGSQRGSLSRSTTLTTEIVHEIFPEDMDSLCSCDGCCPVLCSVDRTGFGELSWECLRLLVRPGRSDEAALLLLMRTSRIGRNELCRSRPGASQSPAISIDDLRQLQRVKKAMGRICSRDKRRTLRFSMDRAGIDRHRHAGRAYSADFRSLRSRPVDSRCENPMEQRPGWSRL